MTSDITVRGWRRQRAIAWTGFVRVLRALLAAAHKAPRRRRRASDRLGGHMLRDIGLSRERM